MKIRPPAGSCFVQPLSRFQEQEMMIVIPDSVRTVKQPVGKVIDVTLYPENQRFMVWHWSQKKQQEKLVETDAWLQNDQYRNLVGKVIVFRHSVRFEQLPLMKVRLEHIEAILEGDTSTVKFDAGMGLMKRCSWCKSQGEGNILLNPSGYCVKCHRNEKGEFERLDERGMPIPADEDLDFDVPEPKRKSNKIMVSMAR